MNRIEHGFSSCTRLDSERLQPVRPGETFATKSVSVKTRRLRSYPTRPVATKSNRPASEPSKMFRIVGITSYGEEKRNVKVYLTYFPSFVKKPILKKFEIPIACPQGKAGRHCREINTRRWVGPCVDGVPSTPGPPPARDF